MNSSNSGTRPRTREDAPGEERMSSYDLPFAREVIVGTLQEKGRDYFTLTSYLCGGCRKRFPLDQLTVTDERVGKGFRCRECLNDFWNE